MTTRQLNVELPVQEIIKAKQDAVGMNVSFSAYVREALSAFRKNNSVEQRRSKFTKSDTKTLGRKVSL